MNLGNKIKKAQNISKNIIFVPISSDKKVFKLLEKILIWLEEPLKTSLHYILQPLKASIWKYANLESEKNTFSSLMLIDMFLRNFPSSLTSDFESLQSFLLRTLDSNYLSVQKATIKVYHSSFKLMNNSIYKNHIEGIIQALSKRLNDRKASFSVSAIDSISKIVDGKQEFASLLNFKEVPFAALNSAKNLRIIPLAYKCSPDLFTNDRINCLFELYDVMIQQNHEMADAILYSVGELSFLIGNKIQTDFASRAERLISTIMKDASTPESCFALLSLLNPLHKSLNSFIENLFSTTMTDLIYNGIICYCSKFQKENYLRKKFLYHLSNIIFTSNNPDLEIYAFNCLTKVAFHDIQFPLIIQFSKFLYKDNYKVRKSASKFLLSQQKYHLEIPNILLSFISSENDENLRIETLKQINLNNSSLIDYIYPLLYDHQDNVVNYIFESLCHIPKAISIVSSYITEIIQQLNQQESLNHRICKSLLIASKYFPQMIIPFASIIAHHILQFKVQTSVSLLLLSFVMTDALDRVNTKLLKDVILNYLRLESTTKIISASLDLLSVSIQHLDLELDPIIIRLLELSGGIEDDNVRRKLLKVLSQIGPIRKKKLHSLKYNGQEIKSANRKMNFIDNLEQSSTSIPISIILEILNDKSLTSMQQIAFGSLLNIVESFSVENYEKYSNHIISKIQNGFCKENSSIIMHYFVNLVSSFGNIVAPLIPHIVDQICVDWCKADNNYLLKTIDYMCIKILEPFSPFIPRITKLFIESLPLLSIKTTISVFGTFSRFQGHIKMVDYIVIPAILRWIEIYCNQTVVVNECLEHLRNILIFCHCEKYFIDVIKTLNTIVHLNKLLWNNCRKILLLLIVKLREKIFSLLHLIIQNFDLENDLEFQILLQCCKLGVRTPDKFIKLYLTPTNSLIMKEAKQRSLVLSININDFSNIISSKLPDLSGHLESVDWMFWVDELISLSLSKSPSYPVQACLVLAERNFNVRSVLFPISYALWIKNNTSIAMFFKELFKYSNIPAQIIRIFLTVAEIIEITGEQLNVDFQDLAKRSMEVGEYGQSLRYHEYIFNTKSSWIAENLIFLNQNLSLPLAAQGILTCAQDGGFLTFHESLAESLDLWDDALHSYTKKLKKNPDDKILKQGKMRCLEALLQFNDLAKTTENENSLFSASSSWRLNNIERFSTVVSKLENQEDPSVMFYQAIHAIIQNRYQDVHPLVLKIQKSFENKIFPLISKDYERTFKYLSISSYLTILEEIVTIHNIEKSFVNSDRDSIFKGNHKISKILEGWKSKFKNLKDSPIGMFDSIRIFSLYLKPEELKNYWIQFLKNSARFGRTQLTDYVLSILNDNSNETNYVKALILYYDGKKKQAFEILQKLLENEPFSIQYNKTAGKLYIDNNNLLAAYSSIQKLIKLTPKDSHAWQQWSSINYSLFEQNKDQKFIEMTLYASIEGLKVEGSDILQLTLRIISILYKHGNTNLYSLFKKYNKTIPSYVWISLLPQIIGRIETENPELRQVIIDLCLVIGESHPYPILYSILAPYNHENAEKQKKATQIIQYLRTIYPQLVSDILIFTRELMRIASTPWEQWYVAIDKASRALVKENDKSTTLNLLLQLHKATSDPQTMYEIAFQSKYGGILSIAEKLLNEYLINKSELSFNASWNYYVDIFRSLRTYNLSFSNICLSDASPALYKLHNSPLNVPGTYSYGSQIINIQSINNELTIIRSKQRPRKMTILGSNGINYAFLLKAHEDTRLDERVMQLFDYITNIVTKSEIPLNSKLSITTYKVVPITMNVGMIGWVNDCQTIHDLLQQYRDRFNVPLNKEMEISNTYELSDKLTSFQNAINSTKGDDLQKILLLFSSNSKEWLYRRINYTTSLAITSISGYILGLGDRHLSNIMMNNSTSKLVHIDFGDCFEVAMRRNAFPEKVPFRLTRMLCNALEVSGIEGTLKTCFENIMKILRSKNQEIFRLLETFIDDPLIQWEGEDDDQPRIVLKRIQDKLKGLDFNNEKPLSVQAQVHRLIMSATDPKNLSQMFKGWYPWL